MKKIFIFMLMCLMVFPLVASASCGSNNIGTFKSGETISLRQTCDTCTYVNVSSVTLPNSSLIYINKAMTKTGIEYDYSYLVSDLGDYFYVVRGDKNGVDQSETFCFGVTPSGASGSDNIVLYIILIILTYGVGFIGFFGKNIWVAIIGGMSMMMFGLYIVTQGIVIYINWLTNAISALSIALGAFFAIYSLVEYIQDMGDFE
jgi:hypothetical protein